jgi:hypothetical protein
MTTAYVFSTLAAAQACAAAVDAAMGYSRPGDNVGPGMHAPAADSVTSTYAAIHTHPTLPLWAYPVDPNTTGILGPLALSLGLPIPTVLDAGWTPAIP